VTGVTCAAFDEAVEDLVVDEVAEPRRSELLAHAATCDRCRARLDELVDLADQLLLLAPPVDPPEGFDVRAAARMGADDGHHRRRHRRRVRVLATVAVAILALAALGGALAAGRASVDPPSAAGPEVRAAPVVRDGTEVGEVQLVPGRRPLVVLTADRPQPFPGVRHCYLMLADGSALWAGEWNYDGIASGVWAATIDPAALDAVGMEIRDDQGQVLATATF
jgi:hypothetical protein